MRITSGGAALIGNGVPQNFGPSIGYMLAIRANSGTQTYFSIALPDQTADSTGVVLGLDTSSAYLTVRDNKPLKFSTNDLERMSIGGEFEKMFAGTTLGDVRTEVKKMGKKEGQRLDLTE
jgi:hypothetical protein